MICRALAKIADPARNIESQGLRAIEMQRVRQLWKAVSGSSMKLDPMWHGPLTTIGSGALIPVREDTLVACLGNALCFIPYHL